MVTLKMILLVGLPVLGAIFFSYGHQRSIANGEAWDAPSLNFGSGVLGFLCGLVVAAFLVKVVL